MYGLPEGGEEECYMNRRDWDFAIGSLGDPLADIHDWMLPPFPSWLPKPIRMGYIDEPLLKEALCRESIQV